MHVPQLLHKKIILCRKDSYEVKFSCMEKFSPCRNLAEPTAVGFFKCN